MNRAFKQFCLCDSRNLKCFPENAFLTADHSARETHLFHTSCTFSGVPKAGGAVGHAEEMRGCVL